MKSSLRKLREFTRYKSGGRDKRSALDVHRPQHGDDGEFVAPTMQVLTNMQEQYDGLLAAAQSISGSSYDFSRSIHEMASYMVETFGKTGDGDTGSSFSMLAKVQYEISKLLDRYAAHVSQTIIKPTENLLKELEAVEEIRKHYEEKRDLYNQMKLQKPKARRKKGDAVDQQLSTIKEQLSKKATQLDLRFQSLKHGQELSLMTQAARHHKAQVHLFSKGLNSLNAVESMIKQISSEFHIDETLSEGESGRPVNTDRYEREVDFLETNDEEGSNSSSPSSSQPMTAERRDERRMGSSKPWENTSKSAPLHPSFYLGTTNAPVVQDLDIEGALEKLTTYALPSPTGPHTARILNQGVTTASRADQLFVGELPELRRIRTGTASTSEEVRVLPKVDVYSQSDAKHVVGREEVPHAWKENKGLYRGRRSPSHSHSTSFSEGLDPLSASSHAQPGFSTSTPTAGYKRATRENDLHMPVTHSVDPLYKSGPIGRSAPWGLAATRVSPCASPPMSHLSPPLISELHKLPAPPPPPPPPPPPKLEPVIIAYSAPLGTKPGHKLITVTPTLPSLAATSVKKSRSIPSSVNFTQNLHHAKLIHSDDSPVVESP